jgi:hypothetical protein
MDPSWVWSNQAEFLSPEASRTLPCSAGWWSSVPLWATRSVAAPAWRSQPCVAHLRNGEQSLGGPGSLDGRFKLAIDIGKMMKIVETFIKNAE